MKAERRPCTSHEAAAIECLAQVRFPVASWDKRFARNLCAGLGLTDREAPQLWRLLLRYRRQWRHADRAALLTLAEQRTAPDLRKLAAAQRDQARINQLRAESDAGGKPAPPLKTRSDRTWQVGASKAGRSTAAPRRSDARCGADSSWSTGNRIRRRLAK